MPRMVAVLVLAALLGDESHVVATPHRLIQVLPRESVSQKSLVCPCEFDLGTRVDGETALIVDRNGTGQPAFARIDGVVLRLANTAPFRFACDAEERVEASWESRGVTIRIRLTTDGPGEESCWFRGELTARKGRRKETRRIIGACGC